MLPQGLSPVSLRTQRSARVCELTGWPKAGGPGDEGRDPLLTSFSAREPPFHWQLAVSPTNGRSETVSRLGEGPTTEPANGRAGQLTVAL